MASKTIKEVSVATTLNLTDKLPISQNSTNAVTCTILQIKDLLDTTDITVEQCSDTNDYSDVF